MDIIFPTTFHNCDRTVKYTLKMLYYFDLTIPVQILSDSVKSVYLVFLVPGAEHLEVLEAVGEAVAEMVVVVGQAVEV